MLATLLELSSVAAKSFTFGEAQAAQAPAATELTGVEVGRNADGVTVTLKGNGKLAYGTLQEADRPPLRLVVDFPGVRPNVPPATPGQGALRRVRVALNNPNPLVTRVVLDLDVKVTYSVKASPDGREVTVVLAGPSTEQTAVEPARSAPAMAAPVEATPAAPAATSAANRLTGVVVGTAPEGVTLTLRGNGMLPVAEVEEAKDAPARLVLTFPGVRPAATALTNVKKGVVDRVRVAGNGTPGSTRVVVEMSKPYAYRVQPDAVNPRNVVVTIGDPAALGTTPADFTLARAVTASTTAAPAAAVRTPTAAVTRTARTEPVVQERKAGDMSPRRFTGHPISLDFQGVDLRAVLRTFAEITGLNLVIDPEVKGVVDVSLHEVPWDHALDIILRANQLDYTVEGTIVRIAPIETLRTEGESRRKLAEEQALSGELVTVTKMLSYAKAADLAPLLLRTALTKRSSIQVDPRTNNLIISDLQAGIDRAMALLVDLDAPQPQVEIEARIVRTTKDFAKELGIQWGFGGAAAPELGNTTPFAFPNTIRAGGSAGTTNQQGADFGKISLGALNGAFSIDAALSALETDGKVQVLLKPRVVTQNNIKATITRGEEIPYTTLSAAPSGGDGFQIIQQVPQVSFKIAALTLAVLPRISASGTVILEVDVDNGSRGTVQANGNISVNTQRVQTTVLVKDQGTTVIGGIYETLETRIQDRTPGLSRVPFIGNFFKRNQQSSNEGELLVFITPRILKSAEAVTARTNPVNGAGK
ncbi:MAG: type IV pilus secretin PilQ [Vicinamibacteraceae bacterium]